MSSHATEMEMSTGPGGALNAPPLLAYVATPPGPVSQLCRSSWTPSASTVKFASTSFGGVSRVPQSTSTETSYEQDVAPRGSTLKYGSPGPAQPPMA